MPRAKVTVYLDEDIGNALSAQAASEGRSVSQMAARLLADLLAGRPVPAPGVPHGARVVPEAARTTSREPVVVRDEYSQE